MFGEWILRFNDRFSIAGAAGVLGLVIVVGLFGLLSVLGADPSRPLNRLGSEGEEVVAKEGSDGQPRSATAGGCWAGEGACPWWDKFTPDCNELH